MFATEVAEKLPMFFTATSMTMIRILKKNKQKILFYEKINGGTNEFQILSVIPLPERSSRN